MQGKNSGVALIMVIFIIVGLTVIAAPLAYMMFSYEQENTQLIENSKSNVAVFGARNHAIDKLARLVSLNEDENYSNSISDYDIKDLGPGDTTIKKTIGEFNTILAEKASWGASAVDTQSKINLNTLSPLLCKNITGRKLSALYDYRISGTNEGEYRLFRSIYEARRFKVSSSEMNDLQDCTTVWSGSNVYGHCFSREIPATIDNDQNLITHVPGVEHMIVPGIVVRIQGPDGRFFRRINSIDSFSSSERKFAVTWNKEVESLTECTIRFEIPRPVNVNTASRKVLNALFSNLELSLGANSNGLSQEDVSKLVEKIIRLRDENNTSIEGYNEMGRIIIALFGNGSVQSSILLRSISWPSRNLYQLNGYTAPLCYSSDNVYEISSFASLGSETHRQKSQDDLHSVVSTCPLGEIAWSFSSQFAWQNLLRSGFGPHNVTGGNTCMITPPVGHLVDVNPDRQLGAGYVSLNTERVALDEYTTFIAHFDTGTSRTVFDADWGTKGEYNSRIKDLKVTEDPKLTGLDSLGLNFQNGGTASYTCQDNISWQDNDYLLKMMTPIEIEFWITLPKDWLRTVKCTFLDWGGDEDNQNCISIGWNPRYHGGAFDLTVSDAGLDIDSTHYMVPVPDPDGYIELKGGCSYHIRAVITNTFMGGFALLIDGKKLPGYFCDQDGYALENGYTTYVRDYVWSRGLRNIGVGVNIAGDIIPGNSGIDFYLARRRDENCMNKVDDTNLDGSDDSYGFTAYVTDYLGPENVPLTDVLPTESILYVDSVTGFPDSGVLYCRIGSEFEFIIYHGIVGGDRPCFTNCHRGATITITDRNANFLMPSKALNLRAFNVNYCGADEFTGKGIELTLMSIYAANIDDYPDAGYLMLDKTSEIIAYLGKGVLHGSSFFYLDVFKHHAGRGQLGTEPADTDPTTCCQVFAVNRISDTTDDQTGDTVTIIKNDQTRELRTIRFALGNWRVFNTPTLNFYETRSTDYTAWSRLLKFPSGELPTEKPEHFFLGSNRYCENEFNGHIDEVKIISKPKGEGEDFMPHDMWYGRRVKGTTDEHYVICFSNPLVEALEKLDSENASEKEILEVYKNENEDREVKKMTGSGFVSVENPDFLNHWHETVYLTQSEDEDPNGILPSACVKEFHDNGKSGIEITVDSNTAGEFPDSGYIMLYSSAPSTSFLLGMQSLTENAQRYYYYSWFDGATFGGLSRFIPDDSFHHPISSASYSLENIADNPNSICVILISTRVRFAQRGSLWTQKLANTEFDTNTFAFAEGSRMLCHRYPYGVVLDDLLDSSDDASLLLKRFTLTASEETIFHFELGREDSNSLEVIGVSKDMENEDGLHFFPHFRGCFGTNVLTHYEEEIATLIPVRYADCSKRLSDSQFLRYLTLQNQLPGMRIRALEWQEEDNPPEEAQIRIQFRVDNCCSWDTEPGEDSTSLREWESPCVDRMDISCNDFEFFPASIAEFRIFFEWKRGAYLTNSWKDCIRLKTFKMLYERPSQILSSRKSLF